MRPRCWSRRPSPAAVGITAKRFTGATSFWAASPCVKAGLRRPNNTSSPPLKPLAHPPSAGFGPNMTLANELLAQGEKETVLEFFKLCANFWKDDKLAAWARQVNQGFNAGLWQ